MPDGDPRRRRCGTRNWATSPSSLADDQQPVDRRPVLAPSSPSRRARSRRRPRPCGSTGPGSSRRGRRRRPTSDRARPPISAGRTSARCSSVPAAAIVSATTFIGTKGPACRSVLAPWRARRRRAAPAPETCRRRVPPVRAWRTSRVQPPLRGRPEGGSRRRRLGRARRPAGTSDAAKRAVALCRSACSAPSGRSAPVTVPADLDVAERADLADPERGDRQRVCFPLLPALPSRDRRRRGHPATTTVGRRRSVRQVNYGFH